MADVLLCFACGFSMLVASQWAWLRVCGAGLCVAALAAGWLS